MRILVTGANGYIGLRLIPQLLESGYSVIAMVRNKHRFPIQNFESWEQQIEVIEGDFLKPDSLPSTASFSEIDAAYYLLHSMGAGKNFPDQEKNCAQNFTEWLKPIRLGQVVYLSGISPQGSKLSDHLESRATVARILEKGNAPLTTLRASIIVGSGSASFEIIRDLVEKLPAMSTPRWTRTKCQPIAIRNVIEYLLRVIDPAKQQQFSHKVFDIGGPQVLTYQEMLEGYAKVRGLKRFILPVPFLSPKLSAYWLYFMTSTSFPLARALVNSLHIQTTCEESRIKQLIPQELLSYQKSIELALSVVAQNRVPSVWFNSLASGTVDSRHIRNIQIPEHGVLDDTRETNLRATRQEVIDAVWSLGGKSGWPSMHWAWHLRGLMDKCLGGSGMRRGRRDPHQLNTGDALDFWRVILVDKEAGRLILFAEMKLPGEAWLEYTVNSHTIKQRAVFRPRGLMGRLYWACSYPFHLVIFPRMLKQLSNGWMKRKET